MQRWYLCISGFTGDIMGLFRRKKKYVPFWIRKTHLFRKDGFICSECGYNAKKAYKTCPCCKAPMSKEIFDPSWVDEIEMQDMMFDD